MNEEGPSMQELQSYMLWCKPVKKHGRYFSKKQKDHILKY